MENKPQPTPNPPQKEAKQETPNPPPPQQQTSKRRQAKQKTPNPNKRARQHPTPQQKEGQATHPTPSTTKLMTEKKARHKTAGNQKTSSHPPTMNTKHDTLSRSQTTHPPGLHDPHPRTASSRKRSRSMGQPHVRSRFRTGAGGNRSPTTFQSSASVGSLDLSIPARAGENITHRRGGGQTERR